MWRIKFLCILLCCASLTNAQNVSDELSKFSFVRLQADTIINDSMLQRFFAKLQSGKQTVNIVHIGDSHIQGNMLTAEVRRLLQEKFGNAGRGLVFPYSLIRTNGSRDAVFSCKSEATRSVIRKVQSDFAPGVAGYAIKLTDSLIRIDLKSSQPFDNVAIICRPDSAPTIGLLRDSILQKNILFPINETDTHKISLPESSQSVSFFTEKSVIVDGFVLRNNQPGVVYHSIGVNGAHFADYNRWPEFYRQLPLLQPDLIIVSLGTNEGVNRRITNAEIKRQVEIMFHEIEKNSDAPVLLITTFDNYYRRKSFNKYLRIVNTAIAETATENRIALIDAYTITGGYKSAAKWRSQGLVSRDAIHYTAKGYELQGKIIYQAIINSYVKHAAR
ncbi:MAG: GDSL-type esterase/lipase family protein [Paludibacter sp.]|nr:GDSL-type esterase/lipase family protein [Paludibacter sp.]